jgi:hypothetical protein
MVDSCPPCCVPDPVNTEPTLPTSAPFIHNERRPRSYRNTTGCSGADLANTDAGLFTHHIRSWSEPRDGPGHRFHCRNALSVGALLAPRCGIMSGVGWWPGRAWLRNSRFSFILACCDTPAASSSRTTVTILAPSRLISATARSCPLSAIRP